MWVAGPSTRTQARAHAHGTRALQEEKRRLLRDARGAAGLPDAGTDEEMLRDADARGAAQLCDCVLCRDPGHVIPADANIAVYRTFRKYYMCRRADDVAAVEEMDVDTEHAGTEDAGTEEELDEEDIADEDDDDVDDDEDDDEEEEEEEDDVLNSSDAEFLDDTGVSPRATSSDSSGADPSGARTCRGKRVQAPPPYPTVRACVAPRRRG